MTDANTEVVVDGRRLRRIRSRQAVVDAMIDFVLEEHEVPGVARLSERAGVSEASLFRYFATLDELRRDAIARYFERFDDLISIPDIGEGTREDRIARLVSTRDVFYGRTAPMARLARRQAADVVDLADTLERVRSTFVDQIAQHFAPELAEVPASARAERIAVIAAVTSFEGWEQLSGLGDRRRRSAMRRAIDALTTDL